MTKSESSRLSRPWILFICAVLCCTLWGSAIPVIKTSYDSYWGDGISAGDMVLFAGMRFSLAGLFVLLFGSVMEKRPLLPKQSDLCGIFVICLFQTFGQYFLYYIALFHTSGISTALINGTNSIFSILLACIVFRMERLTAPKAVGCLLGFAGVTLSQLGSGGHGSFTLRGEGLMLLSCLCAALASVLIRRFSEKSSPVLLSGWQFFVGGLALSCCGLLMGGVPGRFCAGMVLSLLYLALVSAVAYTLWSCLLRRNSVSRVTIYGFLIPVSGVVLSAVFLGEYTALNLRIFVSLILISLGICLVNGTK